MTLKRCALILSFLLSLTAVASAGRVTSNSAYGIGPFSFSPCTGCFVGSTLGATITGETYVSTSNPDFVVFDFEISNLAGTYTLDIAGSGAPIGDYGVFTCGSGFISNQPQCSNDVPANVADINNYGTLSSNTASFLVSGAASTDKFVFFVALNDPTGAQTSVTANFEASAVPEPRLLPLLGLAIGAFLLIRRRRVAHSR